MNEKYILVTDLNNYLKNLLDNEPFLRKVYLKGEISNYKAHGRGHLYFSLKDNDSKINAVMFEFNARGLLFTPKDGMNVLVEGKVSVYPATGSYQIYVDKMEEDGLGNLYLKFEELKKKLALEGLFDDSHKLALPRFPTRIGIITASTGAAIKDILSTLERRFPLCETILFPSLVQGPDAKENIVKQLEIANTYPIDLIILGRGGGSIEDLWPFNEELVARAIYNSKIPIISAVGHDVDYTISDFVADLRAPTPTGAAEMAVPHINDLNNYLSQLKIRAAKSVKNNLDNYVVKLNNIKSSYIMTNPLAMYEIKEQKLVSLIDNINNKMNNLIKNNQYEFKLILNKLKLLNPLGILEKGYSVVSKDKHIIKDINNLEINDEIIIKLYSGKFKATVKEKL